MHAASRFEFNPPPQRHGLLRAYALALLVHGFLLAGLTWGVNWRSGDISLAVEAELWSAVPQEAAPPPPPEPEPEPQPAPPPPPPPPKVDTREADAEIALAREKERQLKEKLEQEKLAQEQQERAERERAEKLEREKQERERKLAEEKRRKELEAKRKEEAAAKLREELRQESLTRMAGLAGGTGAETSKGTAQKASGPSSSYAGRIRARVKPNIVFTEEPVNNPSAEVEVRTSPDGTIVGRKLIKSSGNKAWDDAVLKAIDKTERLPRDIDGTVISPLVLTFRPRD